MHWSREETTVFAHTPIGQHSAPAIVCCVIFFVFDCLAVFGFLRTKFEWYDVLVRARLCLLQPVPKQLRELAWVSPGGVHDVPHDSIRRQSGQGPELLAGPGTAVCWVAVC